MTDHPSTREAPAGCWGDEALPHDWRPFQGDKCERCSKLRAPSALPGVREPAEPPATVEDFLRMLDGEEATGVQHRTWRAPILRTQLRRILTELSTAHATAERTRKAIRDACAIIELGDQRLLAGDGPAGNQPPDLSLAEWRTLYTTLQEALNG